MSFNKKTIRDIDVTGKRLIVRAMLNVPIKDGSVSDKMRLNAAKPTLEYLLDHKAKIILISHHSHEGQSLEPVAKALADVIGHEVGFVPETIGARADRAVKALKPQDVLMLENLRFHPEEEANDAEFAKVLSSYGDIFVEDDFTACHREHASLVGIPKYLPAVAGFGVEKEVDTITKALEAPKRPLLAVAGGAKVSTKIPILSFLLKKVDSVFVGGAMANTFLAALGKPVGKSLFEPDQIELTKEIIHAAESEGKKLLLPIDVVVTKSLEKPTDVRTILVDEVAKEDIIADLGPRTLSQLHDLTQQGGTIIWNGPVGVFETKEFAAGTMAVAEAIINSDAYSVVGGGDTCDFANNAQLADKFGFVSTGGGASMELMSGKKLPGVEALQDK